MNKSSFLLSMFLLTAPLITATETDKDSLRLYNMKEVIVTATRIPQEIGEIPQRINTIPFFRLYANPILSADDVLNQISGLTVNKPLGILSKNTCISLRGMGNEQGRTLILLDGVPLNNASRGSVNLNRLNPDLLERIEIVKGPESSLYGGNAMGGIVNMITRTPREGIQGGASFRWGEMGTYATNARLGGKYRKISFNMNGFYQKSNGYNSTPAEERDEETIASFLREYSLNGTAVYRITEEHVLEGSTGWYDGTRGNGNRYFFDDEKMAPIDLTNHYQEQNYRITYQGKAGETDWQLSGFYGGEKYTEQKSKGSSLYDVNCTRRDWGIWFNGYDRSLNNNLIGIGTEIKGGYVDGRDVYQTSTDVVINKGKNIVFGLWLQDEISICGARLKIIPSLRYDVARIHNAGFYIVGSTPATSIYMPYTGVLPHEIWHAFSPKLSLQYTPSSSARIFANSGWGFRPGTLEDMTRTGAVNCGVVIANPKLRPETVQSTELGGDFSFLKYFILSPSVFYSRGRNFIYNVNTGETILMGKKERPLLRKTNIAKTEIVGFEADLSVALSDHLNFFSNYSYTHAKIRKGSAAINGEETDLAGSYLTYVPKNKIAAGGTWYNPVANLNLAWTQYGKQYQDDLNKEQISAYGTLDVKVWHTFESRFTVSLNARNIFNRQVDFNGMISMGRLMFAGVEYNF